jgi:hypothetical protein
VRFTNLITFSAQDAGGDAAKAAAKHERTHVTSAHEFCLITSSTWRTARNLVIATSAVAAKAAKIGLDPNALDGRRLLDDNSRLRSLSNNVLLVIRRSLIVLIIHGIIDCDLHVIYIPRK